MRHGRFKHPDHEVADRFQSLLRLVLQDRHPVAECHRVVGGAEDRLLRGVECIDEVGKVHVAAPDSTRHLCGGPGTEYLRRNADGLHLSLGPFDPPRELVPRFNGVGDAFAREFAKPHLHAGKRRFDVDALFLELAEHGNRIFQIES